MVRSDESDSFSGAPYGPDRQTFINLNGFYKVSRFLAAPIRTRGNHPAGRGKQLDDSVSINNPRISRTPQVGSIGYGQNESSPDVSLRNLRNVHPHPQNLKTGRIVTKLLSASGT